MCFLKYLKSGLFMTKAFNNGYFILLHHLAPVKPDIHIYIYISFDTRWVFHDLNVKSGDYVNLPTTIPYNRLSYQCSNRSFLLSWTFVSTLINAQISNHEGNLYPVHYWKVNVMSVQRCKCGQFSRFWGNSVSKQN